MKKLLLLPSLMAVVLMALTGCCGKTCCPKKALCKPCEPAQEECYVQKHVRKVVWESTPLEQECCPGCYDCHGNLIEH